MSTWFLYNNRAAKAAVREAMADQAARAPAAAVTPDNAPHPPACTPTSHSREEIKDLKKERNAVRRRLQLALGAQIDNVARPNSSAASRTSNEVIRRWSGTPPPAQATPTNSPGN
ncbi:hypothetical protein [Streptodolium elevatio]